MTRPLRIGLIMQGSLGWIGGSEYIRNIILALSNLPPDTRSTFEISLLITKSDADSIDSMKPYVKRIHVVDEQVRPTVFNLAQWGIRRYIFRLPDNRFGPIIRKNRFDFVYPYIKGYDVRKTAAWIPDFQHKYLTQFFSDDEIKFRDKVYGLMARKASLVVLSSRCAEADFKKYYPEHSPKTRILSFKTCLQPAWFELDPVEVQAKYSLPDRFFIISNQFWQHKNHMTVFGALKLLKNRGINPVVVCTGHMNDYRQPRYSDTVLQAIHQFGLAHHVYLLGLIPKIDQIQLLRRSLAVIQPSLFEGWSTVVEEARAFGKHLILSDIPVHVEQNPPKGRYFTCSSPESLADAMAEYWQSLKPGPDPNQEEGAKETNKSEVTAFANSFLEIAQNGKS